MYLYLPYADHTHQHSFPTRRSSDLIATGGRMSTSRTAPKTAATACTGIAETAPSSTSLAMSGLPTSTAARPGCRREIGRASCRERVEISVGAVASKKEIDVTTRVVY